MPAGPELGMRLALIDPHDVDDEQLLEVLNAEDRQLAHQQARKWRVMAEIARRDPFPNLPGGTRWRAGEVFEAAVDEIRAELVLTRRSAGDELANAVAVASMPRVMQALSDGAIDRVRAIRFADGCTDLTGEQTEVLLDELLPDAGQRTGTELADRIQKVAIALDPAWAQRRYTQALREQPVVGYLNRDGSAVLTGQNLPADDAALAGARVDALADAAKRAGAKARIDLLRATVFLGLLNARFHGMTQQAIVADLVRQFPKKSEPAQEPAAEPTPKAAALEPTAPTDAQPAPAEPAPAEPAPVESAPVEPVESAPAASSAGEPVAGVHLRVGLASLLGLDDQPGEIAGMGNVPAPVARRLARRQRRAEWRYAILDQHGRWLFDGITRRRPRGRQPGRRAGRRVSGGIVELHVPLTLLTNPETARAHPHWAGVLADLTTHYAAQAPIEQDPTARYAGRPLRRRQQTRFQRCTFRGCRRPATDCDLDHEREHRRGGQTEDANLSPDCTHDHQLKTNRGWRVTRRNQHTLIWISPLGRKHLVQIDPIAPPLPAPIPRQLPPEHHYPDNTEPGPSFQPLDQHGRPLASTAPPQPEAIEPGTDPPPF